MVTYRQRESYSIEDVLARASNNNVVPVDLKTKFLSKERSSQMLGTLEFSYIKFLLSSIDESKLAVAQLWTRVFPFQTN